MFLCPLLPFAQISNIQTNCHFRQHFATQPADTTLEAAKEIMGLMGSAVCGGPDTYNSPWSRSLPREYKLIVSNAIRRNGWFSCDDVIKLRSSVSKPEATIKVSLQSGRRMAISGVLRKRRKRGCC